jgi:hypothetical protein
MCSGCGRCGEVESGCDSSARSLAPSFDLEVPGSGSGLQTNVIPEPAVVTELVNLGFPSAP